PLKSVPSWNFTPSTRWNVYSRPSSLTSQDSARSGAGPAVPRTVPTTPSKIWRATRNDSPSLANAGSSELGSGDHAKVNATAPPPVLPSPPPASPPPSSSRWGAHPVRMSVAAAATAAHFAVLRMVPLLVLRMGLTRSRHTRTAPEGARTRSAHGDRTAISRKHRAHPHRRPGRDGVVA